jgi:hypothetical protein
VASARATGTAAGAFLEAQAGSETAVTKAASAANERGRAVISESKREPRGVSNLPPARVFLSADLRGQRPAAYSPAHFMVSSGLLLPCSELCTSFAPGEVDEMQ